MSRNRFPDVRSTSYNPRAKTDFLVISPGEGGGEGDFDAIRGDGRRIGGLEKVSESAFVGQGVSPGGGASAMLAGEPGPTS